jgi:hypothetical protein
MTPRVTPDPWEAHVRAAFGDALAAVMEMWRGQFEATVRERDALRERVVYLETRVRELTK